MATIGVSVIIFYFVSVRNAKHPRTMTREWQEATNEYMKEQKSNPLTGIASKDYKGRGYVTSFPTNPKET
ncbi:Cytochrome c oxidase subunit 5A [Coelomomyces lativittatus]|nr:Cytochrome c oxidase subunit 5A [Coelomomyces lativittatus]